MIVRKKSEVKKCDGPQHQAFLVQNSRHFEEERKQKTKKDKEREREKGHARHGIVKSMRYRSIKQTKQCIIDDLKL
jgi:hypothetical protein